MNSMWTFRRKVTLSIAAAALIVAMAVSAFVYITFKNWTARQEAEILDLKLGQLEIRINEVEFLPHLLRPGKGKGTGPASVFDPDLSSLAGELEPGQRLELMDNQDHVLAEVSSRFQDKGNNAAVEKAVQLKAFGDVKLRLTDSGSSPNAAALAEVGRILIIALLIAAVLAAIIGSIVSRSALAPIRRMIREVRSIGSGSLSKRLRLPAAKDELYLLADTFNGFLQKLALSFEQQRRFVADASHELKTPIAIIEGHAHMVQRWGKSSPAVLDESLGFMLAETKRMKELVAQLLLLAESEEDRPTDADEISDLAVTLNELISNTSHVNAEVTLDYEDAQYGEALLIRMPEERSYQIVRNIVENALKYTPAGGTVRVRHEVRANEVVLTVEDTGIGIAEEHLPHVFDRFYRTEDSRNRSMGGSGLGLAITKTILERYGGRIDIKSAVGQGTTVTLHFVKA